MKMPSLVEVSRMVVMVVLCWNLSSCCSPPEPDFMEQPKIQQQMAKVQGDFLAMLPADQQKKQAAVDEARWLVKTAFEQAAILGRENKPVFIGWINNTLVNSKILDRGLCWHYQHDLYRELRRRHLTYFCLGLTIRDRGRGREHSCVYVNVKGGKLPGSIVLDAWANCGNLKLLYPKDRKPNWKEAPDWQAHLEFYFPEGHKHSKTAHLEFEGEDGDKTSHLVQ